MEGQVPGGVLEKEVHLNDVSTLIQRVATFLSDYSSLHKFCVERRISSKVNILGSSQPSQVTQ